MTKLCIIFILWIVLLSASYPINTKTNLENSGKTNSMSLNNIPDANAELMIAPPQIMPGYSTEITFLNSYGWETFEATASFSYLTCGTQSKRQKVTSNIFEQQERYKIRKSVIYHKLVFEKISGILFFQPSYAIMPVGNER